MAGFQKQVKNSLKFRLSVALSVAILFTAVISCGLTFYFALDEAHELQDDTLTQIASVIHYNPDIQSSVHHWIAIMIPAWRWSSSPQTAVLCSPVASLFS
nr:Uncharacterised protein [Raoultella sp. NCTC 9187]